MPCFKCGAHEDTTYLMKCPLCHKMVCEECRFVKSGNTFCSRECGEMFFYDEDADDQEED